MLLKLLETFTGIFVIVQDGQHAVKFTLGRAKDVVGPGIHFKWPIIQTYVVEETKHTTLHLDPQIIQLNDDLIYEITVKVLYQIVDLKKAMIEVDELVTGLQNRVAINIQRVVQDKDRESIRDGIAIVDEIKKDLVDVSKDWGIHIIDVGFASFAPTAETLEITQLSLLSEEKLRLYKAFRVQGLSESAAVSLISGAVVTMPSTVDDEEIAMPEPEAEPEANDDDNDIEDEDSDE